MKKNRLYALTALCLYNFIFPLALPPKAVLANDITGQVCTIKRSINDNRGETIIEEGTRVRVVQRILRRNSPTNNWQITTGINQRNPSPTIAITTRRNLVCNPRANSDNGEISPSF